MAIQHTISITGKMQNLIFYSRHGRPCVRMMPDKVRQSKATKETARLFGIAARTGKMIREELHSLYSDLQDGSIMGRLNGALVGCVKTAVSKKESLQYLPFLSGFNFNKETSFYERFKKHLRMAANANGIAAVIPRLKPTEHIAAPPATKMISLKLAVSAFRLDRPESESAHQIEIAIPYTESIRGEQQIAFPVPIDKNHLVILAAALRYSKTEDPRLTIGKKQWMPVTIVDSLWTGM